MGIATPLLAVVFLGFLTLWPALLRLRHPSLASWKLGVMMGCGGLAVFAVLMQQPGWILPYTLGAFLGFCSFWPTRGLSDLILAVAALYGLGGGFWLGVAVSGANFLGYGGVNALLTCNHFHYAGMGACGVAGGLLRQTPECRWARRAGLGLAIGMSLVATGITLAGRFPWGRCIEVGAVVWESGSLLLLGLALRQHAARISGPAKLIAQVAFLASLLTAPLALAFSAAGFAHLNSQLLNYMLWGHGVLNAVAVVGGGLTSVILGPSSPPARQNVPAPE